MKKYNIDLNDSIKVNNHTLYRVIYTGEFINAYEKKFNRKLFKKGGYIESKINIANGDFAIVQDDAIIMDEAIIYNNAIVMDKAIVMDEAIVGGTAKISGTTKISGDAIVKNISIGCSY